MAAAKGSLLLIYEGANLIAGLRSTSLSVNNETVDITNKDSSNWRTLLAGAGVKSVSVSGSGVFTNETGEQAVLTAVENGTALTLNINFDGATGTQKASGSFIPTSIEYAGEYNGEQTYSMSFESSGAITFASM